MSKYATLINLFRLFLLRLFLDGLLLIGWVVTHVVVVVVCEAELLLARLLVAFIVISVRTQARPPIQETYQMVRVRISVTPVLAPKYHFTR